jgi:hypothetical protein
MLKSLPFITGVFISGIVSAQSPITIHSSDFANANDSILISIPNPVGILTPTSTGANYTWDYSSLTYNSQQYDKFDSPLSFTSPFNLLFNIFNTSYGKVNNTFTAVPGIPITTAYDFFKKSSSSLSQIGSGYTVNSTPLPFYYTSNDVVYKFPMNYLDSNYCDYKFGLPIPTLGYYGQTGHRTNYVDGWGTLTTPFGTFQTIRVKSTIDPVDTIYSEAVSFGTSINRPEKYEYKWFASGMKIPVLEIDATHVLGATTVTNVQYIDSLRHNITLGITENNTTNFNFSIYPNPCFNQVILQYNLSATTPVKISILDIVGKKVVDVTNEIQTIGLHQQSIDVAGLHLNSGIYFLTIQTSTNKEVHKLMVNH